MLDISHIPSQQQSTYIFYATGNWQTFTKPRNAKFIEIFCLGAGAGGGHCTVGATTVNGAGGGGSGGIVRGIIPAFLLPDTLYIQVGKGGAGGKSGAGAQGGFGGISYISLDGTISEQTLICKSSTATPTGGAASITAGAAATVSVPALSAFGNLGLFTAIAGVIGSTGGTSTPTVGSSQTALATNITTGGAGGGGKNGVTFADGGRIAAASVILTSAVSEGSGVGVKGGDGYGTLQPFCGTGGAGGSAANVTGIGGKGGNGYYGCGGGGGGAGSIVGGFGGDGGDGLVIITVIS